MTAGLLIHNPVIWKVHDGDLCAFTKDKDGKLVKALWAPQEGSQRAFLTLRNKVFECLYEGERGPGKTDAMLMDFAQEVGKGFGAAWRGILFRRTFPELEDVINKSLDWFPKIWPAPKAKYNAAKYYWRWKTGELLYFRQFEKLSDYNKYHGHEYPWQGWEELTNWEQPDGYLKMMSLCRSSKTIKNKRQTIQVPRRIRATTNPYGPGHSWVKEYFRLPIPKGHIFGPVIDDEVDDDGEILPTRIAIHGHLKENKILLHSNPNYLQTLRRSATNEAEYRAWIHGDWNIVAGGMFYDVWKEEYNVIRPFSIPKSWVIDRSFDWGHTKPFSVGWWAESDGSDVQLPDGRWYSTVRGDLFRIMEWYGWNGKANRGCEMLASDIATGIIEREMDADLRGRVHPGPADTQIFTNENGPGIAADMSKSRMVRGRLCKGINWMRADKKPGSRVAGWQKMREMLKAAHPTGKPREHPGLFVFNICSQFIRTIPVLTRNPDKMDDINTDDEDHIADETRYRVRFAGRRGVIGRVSGVF